MTVKILFFAGSARKDSYNKKLAKFAHGYAASKGIQATFADLKDYPMPIYDGDLEDAEGLPENAVKFKKLVNEHDAFFISAPEYNGSLAPLLKNTLDWISRKHDTTPAGRDPYDGKVAAIVSASPGGLGGIRGLTHLRAMLGGGSSLRTIVIPNQMGLSQADKAFDDNGALKDEKQAATLYAIIDRLAEVAGALKTEITRQYNYT